MRHTTARCARIELVGDSLRAHFQTDLLPACGQFLLARFTPTLDPYLPIPLFPSAIFADSFAVDLPRETLLTPDMQIEISGVYGRALPECKEREQVVLIADASPAALLPIATQALARAGAATLLLTQPYPLTALDQRIEVHRGDLISLAKEFTPQADRIFIHLQSPIFNLQSLNFSSAATYTLLTPPMPCGVGACDACYLKTNHGHKKICTDGPFFTLQSLIL